MGTLEKAREYARNGMSLYMDTSDEQDIYCEDLIQAYLAGAKSEREELTRWHDPKEELPKDNRDVLVKTTLCARYCIAFYKANGARNYHWHENNGPLDDDMVIGWRPIHEL